MQVTPSQLDHIAPWLQFISLANKNYGKREIRENRDCNLLHQLGEKRAIFREDLKDIQNHNKANIKRKFSNIFERLIFWHVCSLHLIRRQSFRGRKRHINIWHINNFSVTPVTDPPGRVPDPAGIPHKAHKLLTPGHQSGDPWPPGRETPPHPGSHQKDLSMFMCLFLS